jgi:hypothetical protein
MVGRADQVDRSLPGKNMNVRMQSHFSAQCLFNGSASLIADVNYSPSRVSPFESTMQVAGSVPVEVDGETFYQERIDEHRTFFSDDVDRSRAADFVAGFVDVRFNQLVRIIFAPPDDSALCIPGIRFVWVERAVYNDDILSAVGKLDRRSKSGNSGSNN